MPRLRPLVSRKSRVRACCNGSRSLGGALRVRLTMSNRSRARVALCAVASSGLRPSRVAFNRLRPQPSVPVRVLLAVPYGRRARSMLHVMMNRREGVATDRHGEQEKTLRASVPRVKAARRPCVARRPRQAPHVNTPLRNDLVSCGTVHISAWNTETPSLGRLGRSWTCADVECIPERRFAAPSRT